jgi:hypothetical protein
LAFSPTGLENFERLLLSISFPLFAFPHLYISLQRIFLDSPLFSTAAIPLSVDLALHSQIVACTDKDPDILWLLGFGSLFAATMVLFLSFLGKVDYTELDNSGVEPGQGKGSAVIVVGLVIS